MRVAFVTPRSGPGVLGGSEAFMREAAEGFAARGHEVEVLTTCAVDHYTWDNVLPRGTSREGALVVHRFSVVRHHSADALAAQWAVQAGKGAELTLDQQVSWLSFQFSAPGLFAHLLRHGHRYDAVVFSPYLFWSTSVCMPLVAERAVVVPCLHDEVYARVPVLRPVLASPSLVWFLSAPEHGLAHRLGPVAPHHSVTGAGVRVPPSYDPDGFRRRHGLERPFVLFAGRREEGKGGEWLERVRRGVPEGFDVVVIGKGDGAPGAPAGEVGAARGVPPRGGPPRQPGGPASGAGRLAPLRDIGYVDDAERDNAFAAAAVYVQPSSMESFSRTVMESWLAGTPVVALQAGEVVAWHCGRSGGGLTFADEAGLAEALAAATAPGRGAEMGAAGRRYVVEQYSWPVVLDRMEASLGAALGVVV